MPKGKEKITTHLANVADKILALVADGSPEGQKRVYNAFAKAKERYSAPTYSAWLLVYYWTRTRHADFEYSMGELEKAASDFRREQEFRNFISEGEMATTSGNFYLFKYLLQEFPEYTEESDKALLHILPRLRDLIKEKVAQKEFEWCQEHKEIEDTKAQMIAEKKRIESECLTIQLLDSLEYNPSEKDSNSGEDAPSFVIKTHNRPWHIHWINPYGNLRRVLLDTENDLLSQYRSLDEMEPIDLLNLKIALAAWLNNEQKMIKVKCITDGYQASDYNCFLLDNARLTLTWVNSVGTPTDIQLSDYPPLARFLQDQPDLALPEHMEQLRLLLIDVNTRHQISAEKKEQLLQFSLAIPTASPPKDSIKKLKLEDFKAIEDVLRRGPPGMAGPAMSCPPNPDQDNDPASGQPEKPKKAEKTIGKLDADKFKDIAALLQQQVNQNAMRSEKNPVDASQTQTTNQQKQTPPRSPREESSTIKPGKISIPANIATLFHHQAPPSDNLLSTQDEEGLALTNHS
ncbi:MAG: hypothetical protein JJT82_06965 [Legionellaceae bacterium]|nr:hypothetical protein [Legionellaceae bacterium]